VIGAARTFFKVSKLKNIFDWKEQAVKNRETFITKVQLLRLPKIDLAALAGLKPPKISEYIRGERLPSGEAEKIEDAINAVEAVQNCLRPVKLDTSDAETFWRVFATMTTEGYFEARRNLDRELAGSREAVRA